MAKSSWRNALGFQTKEQLVDSLVEALKRHVPEDWVGAHLEASMVGPEWSGIVTVTLPDKELRGGLQEGRVVGLLRQLRHRMYVRGAGTWYSMSLDIAPDHEPVTTFNYDDEPLFDTELSASTYVRDMQRYGRKMAHRPDWLRAKVGDTGRTGDSAFDAFQRFINGG
jgi:hypothetical protein